MISKIQKSCRQFREVTVIWNFHPGLETNICWARVSFRRPLTLSIYAATSGLGGGAKTDFVPGRGKFLGTPLLFYQYFVVYTNKKTADRFNSVVFMEISYLNKGVCKGVFGVNTLFSLIGYKRFITSAKENIYIFVYILLVSCQINANITKWICMKMSRKL